MTSVLALWAVAISTLMLGGVVAVLVLLRRGDGPIYSASRAYDSHRREAYRLLLGEEVDAVPGAQWFERDRRAAVAGDPAEAPYRDAALEAVRAVLPAERSLRTEGEGRLRVDESLVVPALSTADLRASGVLESWDGAGILVGLVLVNPEPPGGDARRVTLPIQVLFPALERAGRAELIARFAELRARLGPTRPTDSTHPAMEVS